jgi:hypothetical protein
MFLAAGSAPVAVKGRVVNRSTKVRTSLYKSLNPTQESLAHLFHVVLWNHFVGVLDIERLFTYSLQLFIFLLRQ